MSTIRVDNFGPSAGGTTYSARGIAKAWVNFNGTGTIAARDSENVSSLTDNGTFDYTITFSNAFGAADYSFSATSSGANDGYFTGMDGATSPTSSSASLANLRPGVGRRDEVYLFVSIHGDLA
jgi:hypothetical protein